MSYSRSDTAIVGPIEDGSYFTIAASRNSEFEMFYNLFKNLKFYQSPVNPFYYQEILYITARTISNILTDEARITSVVLSAYEKPNQSSFVGYLMWDNQGLILSDAQQVVSLYTQDPSSYKYSSLLSSVRYRIPNVPVEMISCEQISGQFCTQIQNETYNGVSPYIIMIPHLWYRSPNCLSISQPFSSIAYSQCYYYNQDSSICDAATGVNGFTIKEECSIYSEFGKYYYSTNECGESYQFNDLAGNQVSVATSIGACESNSCILSDNDFICLSPPTNDPLNPVVSNDPTNSDSGYDMGLLVVVAIVLILLFIFTVVIIGLLFSR